MDTAIRNLFSDKVDILGTTYTIRVCEKDEDPDFRKRPGAHGYCDQMLREIVIKNRVCDELNDDRKEAAILCMKQTCRHEIVHAYLFCSGLSHNCVSGGPWAMNEEMVDWFAIQGQKIMKSWKESGCMD